MVIKSFSKRRGNYGRSKFRAFLVMEQLGSKYGRGGYLGTRELVILSGLPYRSLSKLLPKWFRYEYVSRRSCSVWSRGDYEYKLAIHGSAWLKCAQERLPNADIFHEALKEWLSRVEPRYEFLLGLPFSTLVEFQNIQLHLKLPL